MLLWTFVIQFKPFHKHMWNCVASCPCVGGLRILSQDLSSGTSMNLRSSFHLFAIIILSSGLAKLRTFASPSHNGAKFSLMKLHQNFYSPKVLGDSHFLSFFIRSPEFDKKTSPLIMDKFFGIFSCCRLSSLKVNFLCQE